MARAALRRFLFLQGPLSPLYARIADRIEAEGMSVRRINLCFGDKMHWRRGGGTDYRGRLEDWPDFIARFLSSEGITDLVFHGDRRLYHRAAADAAGELGIRVVATELGYLRPDWMTIERDGTSTGSHFPIDPDAIREVAAAVGEADLEPRYLNSFWHVAIPDVIYNLANLAATPAWPYYRRHTIYNPLIEYLAAGRRLFGEARRNADVAREVTRLKAEPGPLFVLPMQLEGDFQLRDHSPFGGMAGALEAVFKSFALHAPKKARLLVKSHPLDAGLERWPRLVPRFAADAGIADRVHYLDGGRLDSMLEAAAGMVTVNSSAGIEALRMGVPVHVLSPAIYDVEGLTYRRPLEAFWQAPVPPDLEFLKLFLDALTGSVQARGTIHSHSGLDEAVRTMSDRLIRNDLNSGGGYVDPPPRLARARALGARL